jgi:hypothetical protein
VRQRKAMGGKERHTSFIAVFKIPRRRIIQAKKAESIRRAILSKPSTAINRKVIKPTFLKPRARETLLVDSRTTRRFTRPVDGFVVERDVSHNLVLELPSLTQRELFGLSAQEIANLSPGCLLPVASPTPLLTSQGMHHVSRKRVEKTSRVVAAATAAAAFPPLSIR